MRCLIVSPIPTIPLTQGCAAVIASRARALQAMGVAVHYVQLTHEHPDHAQRTLMAHAWDELEIVPFHGDKVASHPDCYGVDDWYDLALSARLEALAERWRFDFAIVNYVWMSAAFEALSPQTLKVLETHDLFAHREQRLMSAGMEPTWYYTSPEEEARGLQRADVIMAIQDREAATFRSMTKKRVEVVGYTDRNEFLPPRRRRADQPLRLGYIGSGNLTNTRSMRVLIAELDRRPDLTERLELVVAGPIGRALPTRPWIQTIGLVESPSELYEQVDCVINPDIGGSGLKIKSVEALANGMLLLATRNGAEGLNSSLEWHDYAEIPDLVAALGTLFDPRRLDDARQACRQLSIGYQRVQRAAFGRIFTAAEARA